MYNFARLQELCSGEERVDFFRCSNADKSGEDDSEDEETKTSSCATTSAEVVNNKLPNPFSTGSSVALPSPSFLGVGQSSNSVFVTSFQRAEEAKQSILERHVKMTVLPKEDPTSSKKRKSVCRSFQLGKCRYGHKCRYSHDLTAEMSSIFPPVDCPSSSKTDVQCPSQTNSQLHFINEQFIEEANDVDEEDGFGVQMKRRKRAGVTNSLIPPKKALVALDRQRKVDKPWTASLKK